MHEVIVTHVVPAEDDEPAHTAVYRYEFDVSSDSDSHGLLYWIAVLNQFATAGGKLENKG